MDPAIALRKPIGKDVFTNRHCRKRIQLLIYERYILIERLDWRTQVYRSAVNGDVALVLADHAAEDIHQRRLAGAICTHDRDRLARIGVEIRSAQRGHSRKALANAPHAEKRRCHCHFPASLKWSKATKASMMPPLII